MSHSQRPPRARARELPRSAPTRPPPGLRRRPRCGTRPRHAVDPRTRSLRAGPPRPPSRRPARCRGIRAGTRRVGRGVIAPCRDRRRAQTAPPAGEFAQPVGASRLGSRVRAVESPRHASLAVSGECTHRPLERAERRRRRAVRGLGDRPARSRAGDAARAAPRTLALHPAADRLTPQPLRLLPRLPALPRAPPLLPRLPRLGLVRAC